MKIDYRSDTVTRPTPAMLERMITAEVGDAVFGDDPTVHALEGFAAEMFGMDAALFCPSGTMSNQIAIKVHTRPGDQMICDRTAHVYLYEGGGAALHSGVTCRLLDGVGGCFTAADVGAVIQPDDPHFPRTRLVSIENTSNKGGGTCWDVAEIRRIRALCDEHGLRLHLDGARLFNALVATGEPPSTFGELFDSISICLSKGLGAPVGSVLLGDEAFIRDADRMRKVYGGGMRQAGYLAAAGLHALEHHVERLAVDHAHAVRLSEALAASRWPGKALPAMTNIVLYECDDAETARSMIEDLAANDIHVVSMGETLVRLVTHLDISPEMIDRTVELVAGRALLSKRAASVG
ncbi:MAG: GntG family PLP-dependent aldolase [Acidobacteriota bacterium]